MVARCLLFPRLAYRIHPTDEPVAWEEAASSGRG